MGFNYRLTDIQCALGISQLEKIEYFLSRRRSIFRAYNNAFANNKHIILPVEATGCFTNWHLYVLNIDFQEIGKDRADLIKELKNNGIGTQVHYIPVHTQPFYRNNFATNWGDCPVAEDYYKKCLSIPTYPEINLKSINHVIKSIKDICR